MSGSIWKWIHMGFSINKMVILHRKVFLYFLFLLAIENSFAQKLFIPVSDPEIVSLYKKGEKSNDGTYISVDEDGNIRVKGKFDKLVPIGKWYLFYKNGKLMAHYNYSEEGNLDGVFVEYYSNGQVKISGVFLNNKQNKLWKTYFSDGILETEGAMLEGKRYKQWNYYFSSGRIKEVSNYNVRGELHGDLITYDKFGTLVSKANYVENKINGEYTEYYYNGRVALTGFYKLGLKDSVWTEYGFFKKKSYEKRYKNDVPHSKWVYYYPESQTIQKEENYINGVKTGNFREYYYNGRLSKVSFYKNNLLDSIYYEYLPNGEYSVKGEFNLGLKSGIWETYREDGNIYSIGNFENDFQNGDWKFFHRSGYVSSEGSFNNGYESGQWIYYYESGELDEIGSFMNGLREGLWGRFHKNGNLKQEETYKLNKLIHVSDYYSIDGDKIEIGSFENGNGELLDYYENGSVFTKSTYKNGYLNGIFHEFHTNGKISQSGSYNNNLKAGLWIEYNRRGLETSRKKYD